MKIAVIHSVGLFFLVLVITSRVEAQDANLLKKYFGASGGIRAGVSMYDRGETSELTSPFSYFVSGSANIKVGSFDFPFSVTYRDHQYSFSKPYIHLGVSPTYKKIKFHLGYRNMNFSPYTLSGISFLGGGVEFNPGKFRFAAMYGSFQNPYAQRDTLILGAEQIPTYKRKGYAVKLGFGSDRNHADLIYFRAFDDVNSIVVEDRPTLESLKPKDNVAIGLNTRLLLLKRLSFEMHTAASIFTNDENFDKIDIDPVWENRLNSFFNLNGSTRISWAGDASLSLHLRRVRVGLKYRRIQPFFQSLGSYFLQDDTEEYSLSVGGQLLKYFRYNTSVGIQKNNLNNTRSKELNKFIISANIRYVSKGPFSMGVQFNNYDISNTPTIIEDNDSLKLVRVMNQFRLSPSYKIKRENFVHNIGSTITKRDVNSSILNQDRSSSNNNISLRYSLNYKPWKATVSSLISYNETNTALQDRTRFGIRLSARKRLLNEKLSVGLSSGIFENTIQSKRDGRSFQTSVTGSYTLTKKQRINMSLGYSSRSSIATEAISNIRARIDYSLSL